MQEKEDKKKKIIKLSVIAGLILLIVFVIVTTIVINYQKQKIDEVNDKNDQIEQELGEESETQSENLYLMLDLNGDE